jgi:phosphopantothenoylcysteine decarboxylase/phosphopantothenate--cysteine ligase
MVRPVSTQAEQRQAFAGKKILVGVTGGIAAYKAPLLVRLLIKAGADVHVCLTPAAAKFITPLTFETLTGNPAPTDIWTLRSDNSIAHTEYGRDMDAAIIAPATADFLGRLAGGLADQLLLTTLMASRMPVLLCPSMNVQMLGNPLVQRNLELLQGLDRYTIMEPEAGWLACRVEGAGRLPDPERIVAWAAKLCEPKTLTGKHLVITAGPTREWLDPVRFLSNPSTGKMGYALAQAAWERGARVTLITGPTTEPRPEGAAIISVDTTQDLLEAVQRSVEGADALIMAVAPADYSPTERYEHKVKKEDGPRTLALTRTPDVLATVADQIKDVLLVGFSAETRDYTLNAVQKATKKKLDLIFVNDVGPEAKGTGFGTETNAGTLLDRAGTVIDEIPLLSKPGVAHRILSHLVGRMKS